VRKIEGNKSLALSLVAIFLFLVSTRTLVESATPYKEPSTRLNGVGRIVGKVRVEGQFKKPPPLKVYKNRDFCGAEVPNESLVVGPEGVLRNAVIILRGTQNKKGMSPSKSLTLDNKNCAFVPHVQAAPVGSEVLLLNSDPILHDVHARIGPETLFNVGLPTWRQVKKQLNRTGIITIGCEVLHTWMSAYIVVTPSPYFAVTDAKGEFVIDGMLPGSYEIQVWHEQLGNQSKTQTLAAGGELRVDFVYRLARKAA
jgi:hypothetical protein